MHSKYAYLPDGKTTCKMLDQRKLQTVLATVESSVLWSKCVWAPNSHCQNSGHWQSATKPNITKMNTSTTPSSSQIQGSNENVYNILGKSQQKPW